MIEVLAGARDLDQLARWVTDDVYRNLSKRVVLAARARRVKGRRRNAPPSPSAGCITEPADGIVEAVVMVHQRLGRAPSRSASRVSTSAGARAPSACSDPRRVPHARPGADHDRIQ